ncbi:Serine/threonine-protein kinase Bud32 [Carpediemonas membranifera]|uniref:non-specific serine/threonine protein kinase n=1 Tax=Carpediemonas membranifera TaxID=201153 RepID=A0A8J6AV50_9EUKA|nr:Serine/threonine-protein kinase Bud32 [Carpediemonas membranifera]|eukprot:KAG9393290.1 Serine/threonine-protein kinase Bud32 [Carpediemonas membranifera]
MADSREPGVPDAEIASESREMIAQGAEARVYETEIFGKSAILKERFPKTYRIPEIDNPLRQKRTQMECRALTRCMKFNIRAPAVFYVDMTSCSIFMEKIEGPSVREYLIKDCKEDEAESRSAARVLGDVVRRLHEKNIIHGDLTSSNVIRLESTGELVPIDFGLSFQSSSAEDKAVDLYVLERALLSTHIRGAAMFEEIEKVYSPGNEKVVKRLNVVRARGRKKDMVG